MTIDQTVMPAIFTSPMPILPRPGESIASAIARFVRVTVERHECTSDCGERQVTERWRTVEIWPDVVRVLLDGPHEEREYFEAEGVRVTCTPLPGPGPFVTFELTGEIEQ